MKTKPAVYLALYYIDPAATDEAVAQLRSEVLASFGCGDEQWSGLDVHDLGARIWVTPPRAWTNGLAMVSVHCPVLEVPRDFWLSPLLLDTQTFDELGKRELRGEPAWWGLRDPDGEPFTEPDEAYYE